MATTSTLDEILIQAASGRTGWKLPAYAVATSNQTISGLPTIDSVSVPTGESVLLTAQTNGAQNGLWAVSSGAWIRRTDANAANKLPRGTTVMVTHGSVNANSFWTLQTDNIILENTAQTWALNAIFPSSSIDTAATPNTLIKRGTSGQGTVAWIETGTAPLAATGDIRGSKVFSLNVRKSDNLSDAAVLTLDGVDDLYLGDLLRTANLFYDVQTVGLHQWRINGASVMRLGAGSGTGNVAASGTLRLQKGFSITSRNNAAGADLTVLTSDSSDVLTIAGGGFSALFFGPGQVQWPVGVSSPSLTHNANTADVACTNLTLTPQAPWASATGANRTPGSLVIALADPTNGGTVVPSFQIKTGSSTYCTLGKYTTAGNGAFWVGPAAPTTSNYVFLGDGSSVANFNAPSGGSATITFGGAVNTGLDVTSSIFTINPAATQFNTTITPVVSQPVRAGTGANAGALLTLQAQPGQQQSGANNNNNGGKLSLRGGAAGTGGSGSAGTHGTVEIVTGPNTIGAFNYNTGGNPGFTLDTAAPYFVFAANGSTQQLFFQALGASGSVVFESGTVYFYDGIPTQTLAFTLASAGATSMQVATSVTSFAIKQADLTTASGTGATTTIQAQNATGTTSFGGVLASTSGTGTSRRGANRMQIGGTTEIEIAEVVAGNKVIALCRDANLTSTEMPANSGNLVAFLGNAGTVPTANSVSGLIYYSEAGQMKYRDTSGFVVTV